MKKFISTAIVVALMSSLTTGCVSATDNNIKVTYDGQRIEFDVQPEIIDDRVMVPMRTIFETFGMKVKWDGEAQTITAKRKSKTIGMTIGQNDMTKNEDTYSFDTAPVITEGRTLVPIRAISDLLELDVEWDESDKTVVITTPVNTEDDAWKENTGTINLDTLEVTGDGVSVAENVVTVSKGGDFEVTGTLEDGRIVIDTDDEVELRLSGMSLNSKDGSAIYVKNADKAHITITENTENALADGENYAGSDENEKACITSRDSLEIKGKGKLTINGNYNNGIDCADSVEIKSGDIIVNAKNDGIHVNDTLAVSGGTLNVTAEGDGMQADEIVDITGGMINVTTTGVLSESDSESNVSSKGIKADWMMEFSDGEITVNSTDHAIKCSSDINIKGGIFKLSSEVKKGITADGNIFIDDCNIDITKATEGIETKRIITINDGDISIIASDDGINAGGGGAMGGGFGGHGGGQPPQMHENMEFSEERTPLSIGDSGEGALLPRPAKPENDADGGNRPQKPNREDMSQQEGVKMPDNMTPPQMPNGGGFGTSRDEISTEHHVQINGGNIYINAKNDGIDSNGSLVIDGGNIIIEGTPIQGGGEVGLDSDGAFKINGGEVFASGGMMVSASGVQNTVIVNLSETVGKGSVFEIKKSNGGTVAKLNSTAEFKTMIYSSDNLKTGEEYTVYVDGAEKETFTVSEGTTNVGMNDFGGGFGGGRGPRENEAKETKKAQ